GGFFEYSDEFLCRERQVAIAAVENTDLPDPLLFRHLHNRQPARPLFIDHRRFRNDRDAEAHLDGTFYRLDIVELGRLFHLDAFRAQNAVGRFAGRRVAFEQDEVLAAQLFSPDARLLCQWVIGRTAQDKFVRGHLHGGQPASGFVEGDDAEFHASVYDIADHAGGAGILEVDLRTGEFRHKFAHFRRHFVQPDAINGRHLDGSADLADKSAKAFV